MSSNAGRPPLLGVLAVVLVAIGCALITVSYMPRPMTAVWVGG